MTYAHSIAHLGSIGTMTMNLAPILGCLALTLATSIARQEVTNPEATDAGRETYLGREVARTMHWSGADWLLRESREKEENSKLMLANLGIQEGQTLCDFGCGNGYYSLRMAEMVGPGGRVLAVDLQPQMLELLEQRQLSAGLKNIKTISASLKDPGLAPGSCDAIVLVDVYHEISHPVTVLRSLRRALKPKGRLYLLEFRLEDRTVPIKLEHKMSKAQMLLEMHANGLRFAAEFDGLPWQHLMAFESDPEFPRQDGRQEASARALAEGLKRALRTGDFMSLPGFYSEEVTLLAGSPLLSDTESDQGLTVTRRDWQRRIASHVEGMTPKAWSLAMQDCEFDWTASTRSSSNAARPDRYKLNATGPSQNASWELYKNTAGQWLVVSEKLGR
ncbi:MAG: ubiquinone/menaquinone biosynthesis C-methylase UbiE [Candidatus Paceibacteria bacterium]